MGNVLREITRSSLLLFPQVYDLIFYAKHKYFLNYLLKKTHEADFKAFELISEAGPQLFLDIGANVGQSAISIFVVKPNAQVISFEPNPLNHPYLEKVGKSFKNFAYQKVGLGSESQFINLYCPVYNGRRMTPWASFDYEKASQWGPGSIAMFDPSKLKVESLTLEIKTLDSFDLNPDFVKIDVEGFEYQVLLGATETIKRCKPIFLIESVKPDGDVYNHLKGFGYSVYKFDKGKFFPNDFDSCNQFLFPAEKLHLIQDLLVK